MKKPPPLIGVTIGDVAGIGPELIVKVLADNTPRRFDAVVIGNAAVMRKAVSLFASAKTRIETIRHPSERIRSGNVIHVLDLGGYPDPAFAEGQADGTCGSLAVDSLRKASALAEEGALNAVVSAPVNKESMHAGNRFYPGQTEVFAEETGTEDFFTVLVSGKIRLFLLTSHVPLGEAVRSVTPENVERVLRQTHRTLQRNWGLEKPKIAVAGLNPHAGENGQLGHEEKEIIVPAIQKVRQEKIDAYGPFSAEILLSGNKATAFDGIVGMYHDQGVVPLKKKGYVTTIAGLPFVRTTVGHGTAYDIAWQGKADPYLMRKAFDLAVELAGVQKKTPAAETKQRK